jgi:hypothetical protein
MGSGSLSIEFQWPAVAKSWRKAEWQGSVWWLPSLARRFVLMQPPGATYLHREFFWLP